MTATTQTADRHYRCQAPLNLYDAPTLSSLATQAARDRYLRIRYLPEGSVSSNSAVEVCLCEDDYPGWLAIGDLAALTVAETPYTPVVRNRADIISRIPAAIAFTQTALAQPNVYLWGGTLGPNFDCSGLVQTAFAAVGVWLPRDAYQQEAFTQPVAIADLEPGDLVFFGPPHKATHVGLYLGNARYIHSSGKDQGHNGIAIDVLGADGSPVSQTYYAQLRGAGRILQSYQPQAIATR